jgi:hypothetical protein
VVRRYGEDPEEFLQRTFEEVAGYDEMVLLRDIRFVSHCEHHMAPIIGRAHVGYLPHNRVVGISMDRPYTDLIYQPMLEVLQYLRDDAYRIFIVTDGGQDFVRVYAEKVYGIRRSRLRPPSRGKAGGADA